MFSPPKQQTFFLVAAIVTMMVTGISISNAQQGPAQSSRSQAIQRANARAQQMELEESGVSFDAPPPPAHMAQNEASASNHGQDAATEVDCSIASRVWWYTDRWRAKHEPTILRSATFANRTVEW